MDQKTQEAQALQEQRDQYYAHLQQYTAVYQQLASEKEALHKQYLLQMQLMDRLQHEEVQGKVTAEMHFQELQQAKVRTVAVQARKVQPSGPTYCGRGRKTLWRETSSADQEL